MEDRPDGLLPWQVEAEKRARKLACERMGSEGLWELFLFETSVEVGDEMLSGEAKQEPTND